MTSQQKALKAIEYLTGDDFACGLEWWMCDNAKRKDLSEDEERLLEAAKLLGQIYRISHAEGNCKHPDWEKEKDRVIKIYKNQ
jgi:hypothetical protein